MTNQQILDDHHIPHKNGVVTDSNYTDQPANVNGWSRAKLMRWLGY